MRGKFVYFMKPIGMDGPIKIGCTTVARKRIELLSVWSPFPLELIAAVPGNYDDELYLHRCFAPDHTHREWFRTTPKLLRAIRIIKEAGRVVRDIPDVFPIANIRQRRAPVEVRP